MEQQLAGNQRKVLLAVDSSEIAENAFHWYCNNAHREGDYVLIVHCPEIDAGINLPGIMTNTDAVCKAMKQKEDEISNLTGRYAEQLKQKRIQGKVVRLSGKPGEAIVEAAQKEGVAQVVMGTRGLGKIKRTLLGSVSDYVVRNVTVPVTIVPKM